MPGAPAGAAARMGSTPESMVTAVTLSLPGVDSVATIKTASPDFRSASVSFGSLANI
jgi:hypothetical protein